MHLSLERIVSLSALNQAPGNGAAFSHRGTLPLMHIQISRFGRAHIFAYKCLDGHARENTCIHTALPVSWPSPRGRFICPLWMCVCVFEYLKDSAVARHSARSAAPKLREAEEKRICEFTTGCWNDCDALATSAYVGFKWLRNSKTVFTPLIESTDWSVFGKLNTRLWDLIPRGRKRLLTTSFSVGCNKKSVIVRENAPHSPAGCSLHYIWISVHTAQLNQSLITNV